MHAIRGMIGSLGLLAIGCAGAGGPQTSAVNTLGDADGTSTTDPGSSTGDGGSGEATSVADATTSSGSDGVDTTAGSEGPPAECAEDPAACTAWILPVGSGSWTAEALDADSPLAPSSVVRAAFDVEAELEGFVLTDTAVHVVDLAARQWVRVDNRAEVLPELGDDEIRGGYSIPGYWSEMAGGDPNLEGIILASATTIYIYDYEIDSRTFVFDSATTRFGMAWDTPAAPAPAQIRSGWLDVTNAEGWVTGDLMALCGSMNDLGPYAGIVATEQLHVYEAGSCFQFLDAMPLASFEPFSRPGAPAAADMGASLYNETMGLWVFRGS